tara:strand:+ start:70 stop:507 length:438 start_codon:yes stop_codon:yes gene_type:complete
MDLQTKIMDITKELKEKELKEVELLTEKIENEKYVDVIYILRCMKDDYDIEDEDNLYDVLHELLNQCCEEEHENDNYETLKASVDLYGIFKALKLGIEEYGNDIYDIENTSEIDLYKQCYFHILREAFDYTYEDIKLIKEYDIDV